MIDRSQSDYLHVSLIRRDVERLVGHVRGRLLDIGSGSQPYRELLSSRADRYAALDVPSERGSGSSVRPDVYGTAQGLPFADGVFDTVVCFQVLEHVPEPWVLVAEAARVLRPGGCLLITAPMSFRLHGEPNDFFRFTRHGLVSLAERADLCALECSEQGGGWVAVSESILNYFTRHYWRTVRNQRISRALCRLGNRVFGWLDRRFPYPGNPSNLTLVAQKPPMSPARL